MKGILTRRRVLFGLAAWWMAAALPAPPQAQRIRIVARRFSYDPEEITLRRGMPAELELTSADVAMGFSVPELEVRADVVPGQLTRLALTPDRAGTFQVHCDIFCGDGHERMSGTIRVVD